MITYHKGDLLEAPEMIIVHGCNAQGVMGSGVAKAIRDKYPVAYDVYRQHYVRHGLHVGDIIPVYVGDRRWVINAITQETYGRDPNIVYVNYMALRAAFAQIACFGAAQVDGVIAIPKIGAGLGNGDWDTIERIIQEEMWFNISDGHQRAIDVKVYEL